MTRLELIVCIAFASAIAAALGLLVWNALQSRLAIRKHNADLLALAVHYVDKMMHGGGITAAIACEGAAGIYGFKLEEVVVAYKKHIKKAKK